MSDGVEDHALLRSQSDLMAGVAGVFFVLMAIFMAKDAALDRENRQRLAKLEAEDRSAKAAEQRVIDTLAELRRRLGILGGALEEGGVETTLENGVLEINVDPSGDLLGFASGQDALGCDRRVAAQARMRQTLALVCDVMTSTSARLVKHIVLEGHTDNVPVANATGAFAWCPGDSLSETPADTFGGNVALSGRRAVHILRLVVEGLPTSAYLRTCVERHFLVAGRGPVEPVHDEPSRAVDWWADQSEAARRRNRRVVLRVEGRQDYDRLARELGIRSGG